MKSRVKKNVFVLVVLVMALSLRVTYVRYFSEPETYRSLLENKFLSFVVLSKINAANGDVKNMAQEAVMLYGTDEQKLKLYKLFLRNGSDIYSTEFEWLILNGYPGMLEVAIEKYDSAKINIKWFMAKGIKHYKNDKLYNQLFDKLSQEKDNYILDELS